jgi:hypothetical protein
LFRKRNWNIYSAKMVGQRWLIIVLVFMARSSKVINCSDSNPHMMSFTICMRFKLNFLGMGLITVKDRITSHNFLYFSVFHRISSASMWLFKDPNNFFTYLLRDTQTSNIDKLDTFIPNKWFHLCTSFDNSTLTLNTILVSNFLCNSINFSYLVLYIHCRMETLWKQMCLKEWEK